MEKNSTSAMLLIVNYNMYHLPEHSLKFPLYLFLHQLEPIRVFLSKAVLNNFKNHVAQLILLQKICKNFLPFIKACAKLKKRLFSPIVDLNKLLRAMNIARLDNPNTLHNTIFMKILINLFDNFSINLN